MYPSLHLYINGEFLTGENRKTQPIINPATLETLAELPHATQEDLDHALESAQTAFQTWRHSSPLERSDILRQVAQLCKERAEEIGRHITLDQGKPLAEAIGEVTTCSEHADWHAEEARRIYGRVIPARNPAVRQIVVREPIGVCAAFTPWNFPFNQAIRKITAAIAAGCTIIIKGPEDSPSAILALAKLFDEAGLPKGVLNVVWGEPAEISDYLIRSPIVRKVSFTGSVPVGKKLAALAGEYMKPVTMELGGHSPVIICPDANIARVAKYLANFKTHNAGQVCISPTRFYVHDEVFEEFKAEFIHALKAIIVGDGSDADTQMGPLAHEHRLDTMDEFVQDAVAHGATIELGGKRLDKDGYFYPPTVLSNVSDECRIMNEEPFGPLAPLSRFNDIDEVIARANSLPFGLAAYAFTNNLQIANKLSNEIEAGMVSINHFGVAGAETPFGGIKDSGMGREGGLETLDGYLVTKFITQR